MESNFHAFSSDEIERENELRAEALRASQSQTQLPESVVESEPQAAPQKVDGPWA